MVLLKQLSSALFTNKINKLNKTHKHRFSSDEEDVSESEEEESEVDDDAGVEEESEVDDAGVEEESEDDDDTEEEETEQTVRRTGKTNAAKRNTEEETNTIGRKKLKVDDGSKEEKERVLNIFFTKILQTLVWEVV